MLAMEQLLCHSINLKNALNNKSVSAGSQSAILCHQDRIIQNISKADDKSNFLDRKRSILPNKVDHIGRLLLKEKSMNYLCFIFFFCLIE